MNESILTFLYGGLTILCLVAAVFFLRFWRLQHDRFFAWFAAAFGVLGLSWGVHIADAAPRDGSPFIYLLRLAGYVCIIVAIADKNRRS